MKSDKPLVSLCHVISGVFSAESAIAACNLDGYVVGGMLKYTQTLHLTGRPGRLLQSRISQHYQCRRFAFSRFPEPKAPGSFRSTRRRPESRSGSNPQDQEAADETYTSEYDSQLWHTSQRPPASNPEEGLRRLLAENETLVIERCARLSGLIGRISDIGAGK